MDDESTIFLLSHGYNSNVTSAVWKASSLWHYDSLRDEQNKQYADSKSCEALAAMSSRRDYTTAIKFCNDALSVSSDHVVSLVIRGRCYQEMSNIVLAIDDFQAALKSDPTCVDAQELLIKLGRCPSSKISAPTSSSRNENDYYDTLMSRGGGADEIVRSALDNRGGGAYSKAIACVDDGSDTSRSRKKERKRRKDGKKEKKEKKRKKDKKRKSKSRSKDEKVHRRKRKRHNDSDSGESSSSDSGQQSEDDDETRQFLRVRDKAIQLAGGREEWDELDEEATRRLMRESLILVSQSESYGI